MSKCRLDIQNDVLKTYKKALAKKTRAQESEAIRQKVRKDGFIMPHGYAVRKAVREQSIGALSIDQLKKNTEAIERFKNISILSK